MPALVLALAGAILLLVAVAPPGAQAGAVLQNGGFESWGPSGPASWLVQKGSVSQQTGHVVSGSAARLSAGSILFQRLDAMPGATYTASIMASGTETSGSLSLRFRDDMGAYLGSSSVVPLMLGSDFSITTLGARAPDTAVSIEFTISVSGMGSVDLDNAMLEESAPPTPTATPTSISTPTETPTPTRTTSPTNSVTATAAPPTPANESTKTGTPTKAPTPTKTPKPPTPTKTPGPSQSPPATSTPKPPKLATPTPTPHVPTSTFGGLIVNGDFEDTDEDHPWGWSKFGGSMGMTAEAYHGNWAGTLDSDTTSTKWLYQVAEVEAGTWYSATGMARANGGEAWLRLSWYTSDDGSGSALDSSDSDVAASGDWTLLGTGAVQAPEGAASVRLRLMLRPAAGNSRATFDDVMLVEADAPPATPTPTQRPAGSSSGSNETPAIRTATPRTSTPPRSTQGPVPDTAAPGGGSTAPASGASSLRLSELLADPEETGNDAAWEWVEIVNIGTEAVDTAGWQLGDAKGLDVLPSAMLPAGAYAVVAAKSANVVAPVVLRVSDGTIGGGLNNGGDRLRLIAPDGNEADTMSYGDDVSVFEPSPKAAGAGKTLGVKDPRSEATAENWAETEHPTPGEPNVFPGVAANERRGERSGAAVRTGEESAGEGLTRSNAAAGEPSSEGWSTLEAGAGSAVVVLAAGVIGYSQRRRLRELAARRARGG